MQHAAPRLLLDYADVVPGADARLVLHDLARFTSLIDRAVASVQPFYVANPTFIGHKGKECMMHRRVCFLADPVDSHGYFYSKQLMPTTPITPACLELMQAVRGAFGIACNGMLFNEYDRDSYITNHRDEMEHVNSKHGVFAINHGISRVFRIKQYDHTATGPCSKSKGLWWDFPTQEYTKLHMCGGDFQKLLTHGVPKLASAPDGLRTSITFWLHDKDSENKQYQAFQRGRAGAADRKRKRGP